MILLCSGVSRGDQCEYDAGHHAGAGDWLMSEERKVNDLVYERADVNLGLLHQQLKTVLGESFVGLSHDGSAAGARI